MTIARRALRGARARRPKRRNASPCVPRRAALVADDVFARAVLLLEAVGRRLEAAGVAPLRGREIARVAPLGRGHGRRRRRAGRGRVRVLADEQVDARLVAQVERVRPALALDVAAGLGHGVRRAPRGHVGRVERQRAVKPPAEDLLDDAPARRVVVALAELQEVGADL